MSVHDMTEITKFSVTNKLTRHVIQHPQITANVVQQVFTARPQRSLLIQYNSILSQYFSVFLPISISGAQIRE